MEIGAVEQAWTLGIVDFNARAADSAFPSRHRDVASVNAKITQLSPLPVIDPVMDPKLSTDGRCYTWCRNIFMTFLQAIKNIANWVKACVASVIAMGHYQGECVIRGRVSANISSFEGAVANLLSAIDNSPPYRMSLSVLESYCKLKEQVRLLNIDYEGLKRQVDRYAKSQGAEEARVQMQQERLEAAKKRYDELCESPALGTLNDYIAQCHDDFKALENSVKGLAPSQWIGAEAVEKYGMYAALIGKYRLVLTSQWLKRDDEMYRNFIELQPCLKKLQDLKITSSQSFWEDFRSIEQSMSAFSIADAISQDQADAIDDYFAKCELVQRYPDVFQEEIDTTIHQKIKAQVASLSLPGIIGIVNVGNSCYMNASLQALLAIPHVVERIDSPDKVAHIEHAKKECVESYMGYKEDSYAQVTLKAALREFYSVYNSVGVQIAGDSGAGKLVKAAKNLRLAIFQSGLNGEFNGARITQQMDSSALLNTLLSCLKLSTRVSSKTTYYKDEDTIGSPTYKPEFTPMLNIAVKQQGDSGEEKKLQDLVDNFFVTESIRNDSPSYDYTVCNKQLCIEGDPPKILALQLCRFESEGGVSSKTNTKVTLPVGKVIHLKSGLQKEHANALYSVQAIVSQSGSIEGGHYKSYVCKKQLDTSGNEREVWYRCNDCNVTEVEASSIDDVQAYCIILQLQEDKNIKSAA